MKRLQLSNPSPGIIDENKLYRADEFKARMGWSDSAFRQARRKGLKVNRYGKRVFVLGRDVFEFISGCS